MEWVKNNLRLIAIVGLILALIGTFTFGYAKGSSTQKKHDQEALDTLIRNSEAALRAQSDKYTNLENIYNKTLIDQTKALDDDIKVNPAYRNCPTPGSLRDAYNAVAKHSAR